MPEAILAADAVAVSLDGAVLLPETSVALAPGERVAVLGPNGAGKTTLLRTLAGRLRPSGGAVHLRGETLDERRSEARSAIAALIDPPALYPDLTIAEHVALIDAAWTGAASEDAVPAGAGADVLSDFGLEPLHDRFPHELSSGQRQLVSLAVTFCRPAAVMLLDEPEQRLDPHRRELVAAAIRSASSRGIAVAFSSHDPWLVEAVAERSVSVGA